MRPKGLYVDIIQLRNELDGDLRVSLPKFGERAEECGVLPQAECRWPEGVTLPGPLLRPQNSVLNRGEPLAEIGVNAGVRVDADVGVSADVRHLGVHLKGRAYPE